MTNKFIAATWLGIIGFVAGISFFTYTIVTSSRMNTCIVCKRHIHAETRTVAEIDGRRTLLCCPTCARIVRTGRTVRLVGVTDYPTGDLIDPRQAYVVAGSEVNYCMQAENHLDEHKQPAPKMFDRCAPSMISFASLDAAREFQTQHGGEVTAGDFAFAFNPVETGQ